MDTTQDLPIDEQLREEAGEEPAFIVPAENVEVAEDALKSAPIDDDDDMEEELVELIYRDMVQAYF